MTKGGFAACPRCLGNIIPLVIALLIIPAMPDAIQAKSAVSATETVPSASDGTPIGGADNILMPKTAKAVHIEEKSQAASATTSVTASQSTSTTASVTTSVTAAETMSDTALPTLRLSPALPGPRHVSFSDLDGGNGWNSGFMHTLATNPGYAFLASALVPGLGQAANRQWWKTALFVAVEAAAIGVYIHRENRGRDGERYYERFGNENWSVVAYAQYLVTNHGDEHGKSFQQLLTEEGKDQFIDGAGPFGGINPAFDIDIDWALIDITQLRIAERNSFYATGFAFSHDLPDYGSQQYYELMSKYFQFGPGWQEWFTSEPGRFNINEGIMPEQFWYHAQIGFDFNDDLSVARNMLTLLVTNHFLAAFDAYFTQKFRAARMQPTASMEYGLRPTIGMQLRF